MRTGQGGEHPIGDTTCLAPPFVTNEEQLDLIMRILRESIVECVAAASASAR